MCVKAASPSADLPAETPDDAVAHMDLSGDELEASTELAGRVRSWEEVVSTAVSVGDHMHDSSQVLYDAMQLHRSPSWGVKMCFTG
jgi:hypothetical protein